MNLFCRPHLLAYPPLDVQQLFIKCTLLNENTIFIETYLKWVLLIGLFLFLTVVDYPKYGHLSRTLVTYRFSRALQRQYTVEGENW
jgi:hypothetical protein